MASRSFVRLLAFALTCLLSYTLAQNIPQPFLVKTSTKYYGPDGPWQAVEVQLGSPSQSLDLYPGGIYESIILADQVCTGVSGLCGAGGLFNPSASSSIDEQSISFGAASMGSAVDWTGGAMRYQGRSSPIMDNLEIIAGTTGAKGVQNLSIKLVSQVNMTYPDGSSYPIQLGQLSLGSSNVNQSFALGGDTPAVNASLVPGYLWQNKIIPTSSYGLHIGTANFKLPLSLWLGGYDQSRVIGNVSSQPCDNNNFNIDLLDVGIGVDNGGSPFPFAAKQGLLAADNSSISNSLRVTMAPAAPYMYLPNSTCAAIARNLPITYQPKYGLYFWNVQDPRYTQIVGSPSFLSFEFRASCGIGGTNITIRVPFRLLNLTLDAPLIGAPTPYFPCQPPQGNAAELYILGRAFLQAAFIGVNWDQDSGNWFLAQAPGPNTPSSPIQVPFADSLKGSSNSWANTWTGYWTPLPPNSISSLPASPTPTPTESPSAGGLSAPADAGIGIGCAALISILIGAYFYRRRSIARRQSPSNTSSQRSKLVHADKTKETLALHEMPQANPAELYTEGQMVHELGAAQK